jgi:hypothetical protein
VIIDVKNVVIRDCRWKIKTPDVLYEWTHPQLSLDLLQGWNVCACTSGQRDPEIAAGARLIINNSRRPVRLYETTW